MRNNVAALAPLCHALAQWGIEEITFNQLGGNDRPTFFPAHRLLLEQVETLTQEIPPLRAALAAQGVVLRGAADYLARIAASSRSQRLTPVDCEPGQRFLFIDEEGRIAPCGFTPQDYGVPVSAITSPGDIDNLPARFAAARSAQPARACADCLSTQHHGKFAVAVK